MDYLERPFGNDRDRHNSGVYIEDCSVLKSDFLMHLGLIIIEE